MGRATTVAEWARRERLILVALAACSAVAVLADPLDAPGLVPAVAVLGATGAVARLTITWWKGTKERKRERQQFERLLRTGTVQPVGEVDPIQIDVDAASQAVFDGGAVPGYVERDRDGEVREAIAAAMQGRGFPMVVVHGPSKVGKSRTLFEALRATDPDLHLVAPVDCAALTTLLDPADGLRLGDRPAVLWLADLEPFVNEGLEFPS